MSHEMNRHPTTAVIADDEEALRDALRRRLAEVWPDLTIVAEARNGPEALAAIGEWEPQVAFLDIRMPGMDGLEVARRVAGRCHVVFVTAYDEYAVPAFEAEAVDYLLKPVTEERLTRTAERLRVRLGESAQPPRMEALLRQLSARLGSAPAKPLRWIKASLGDVTHLVEVDQVRYFLAADKYTSLFTSDAQLVIRKPIKELEAELDPERFWRVHRNAIVNLAFVARCLRDEEGQQRLLMRGGGEIAVSRAYNHLFRPT